MKLDIRSLCEMLIKSMRERFEYQELKYFQGVEIFFNKTREFYLEFLKIF